MKLTKEEEILLEGKKGYVLQKAMELLVGLGECFSADKMIPISSVLFIGSDTQSTGKYTKKYIKDIASTGAKFIVPTFSDIGAMDICDWKEFGFSLEQYEDHKALSDAFANMDGFLCFTCAPYLIGHTPRMGEHIAWGESSAVIYANAVLGARTNQESVFTQLASALTGKTPNYGYHLVENRRGTVKVIVDTVVRGCFNYHTLGFHVGKTVRDEVPIFTGIPASITRDELVSLGAALATSGGVTHYHIVGVTPEAPTEKNASGGNKITSSYTYKVGEREINATQESISNATFKDIDVAVFGCPHLSIEQIKKYVEILNGRKIKTGKEMWLQASHVVKQYAKDMGYFQILKKGGVKILSGVCSACFPGSLMHQKGIKVVATDSAKLSVYTVENQNLICLYADSKEIIDAITTDV